MNNNEKQKSCAMCHAYLFEGDDVVYCPECGAPHHRECYNSLGHCALESTHGTDMQYDKLKEAEKKNEQKTAAEKIKNDDCYTPGDEVFANFPPMDFLGGVAPDEIIEDGVTAKEARNFVISNTVRYIPKFTQISKDEKTSWNFMAFFFPTEWLFSRKMYKQGFIFGIFMLISDLLALPFQQTILNLGYYDIKSYAEIPDFLVESIADGGIHYGVLIALFLGAVISFTLRLVAAFLGDYWYRQHVITKVKDIKLNSDNIADDFKKQGGVNLFLFLIVLLVMQYLPSIIFMFIRG